MHDKNFGTNKKNSCGINGSIPLQHDPPTGKIANIIVNSKSIFIFLESFFGKNCAYLPYFLSSAELLILDTPGISPPWISLTYSTVWEEVDGTSWLTRLYENVYNFWWDIF